MITVISLVQSQGNQHDSCGFLLQFRPENRVVQRRIPCALLLFSWMTLLPWWWDRPVSRPIIHHYASLFRIKGSFYTHRPFRTIWPLLFLFPNDNTWFSPFCCSVKCAILCTAVYIRVHSKYTHAAMQGSSQCSGILLAVTLF